jgi:hypothetical protein
MFKIKLRFWDETEKKYINSPSYTFINNEFLFDKNIRIERATEFFDKERNLIYEGDVISDSLAGAETYFVEWFRDGFAIRSFENNLVCDSLAEYAANFNDLAGGTLDPLDFIIDTALIIGNVNENKEIFSHE